MSIIKRATPVTLEGRGEVTLRPNDYVTQGGEGAIYRKDKHIIKLYLDPTKLSGSGQADKVRLLARTFTHPSIVAPQGLVFAKSGEAIGFYMPYVKGEALPPLFTNDRDQRGFTNNSAIVLATKMHEIVEQAHTGKALMIDANELNWLADIRNVSDPTPYIIDVDSWQIDRFKASVIMPSIRDWHSQNFTNETDWFAWGIVTFNLLTGIHPYKGGLDGYKPGELERRMKENASVFHPDIRLNKAVRDFSLIPGPLLDWYQATFAQGVRTKPPLPSKTGKTNVQFGKTLRMVTTATGGLIYRKLFSLTGEKIVSVWPCGVVRTDSGALYEVSSKKKIATTSGGRVAVVARENGWLVVEETVQASLWRFVSRSGTETTLTLPLDSTGVFRSGERLFATTETELVEVILHQFAKPLLTFGSRWQILGQATNWYNGVGVSNVLGAVHLVLPFGEEAVAMVRAPELDDLRVIKATAGSRFVEVVTINKQGDYEAIAFTFTKDYQSYTVTRRPVDSPEQNLTALPKGVTAEIRTDGLLTIGVPQNNVVKEVSDKDISTDMRLSRIGDQVVYLKDSELWSLSMT
jgi:hypothetical protein